MSKFSRKIGGIFNAAAAAMHIPRKRPEADIGLPTNIKRPFNVIEQYMPDVKNAQVTEAIRKNGDVLLYYDNVSDRQQVIDGLGSKIEELGDKVKVGLTGGSLTVKMSLGTYKALEDAAKYLPKKSQEIESPLNVVGQYMPDVKGAHVTEATRKNGEVSLFYGGISTIPVIQQVADGLRTNIGDLGNKVKVGVTGGDLTVRMPTRTYNALVKKNGL